MMQINDLFLKFIKEYDESGKNAIWKQQSKDFINQWQNDVEKGLSETALDHLIRYLDTHGRGNTPQNESIAKVMVPQKKWYKIFRNLATQPDLYKNLSIAMFSESRNEVLQAINKVDNLNKHNKNNLTGKTGSAISAFIAISNPFKNLSILSLNDRYKVLQLLKIDYGNLDNADLGTQIVKTHDLICDYFKEQNLSDNARTVSEFIYSDYILKYWKDKKSPKSKDTLKPYKLPPLKYENYSRILSDEISLLNVLDSNEWAITRKNKIIRLYFGGFIVLTVENGIIWTTIDQVASNNLDNLNFWEWDTEDYPEYKKGQLFSKNGYFSGSINEWDQIKEFHYQYLRKIANKKFKLNKNTRKNHDNELLMVLMSKYDIKLPFPSYISKPIQQKVADEMGLQDTSNIIETEAEVIIKQRVGQDVFRNNLLKKYGICIVCGIEVEDILRASHIKPWRESSNEERLDHNNGLLLCANHDLLFDKFFISFAENGTIMIADEIAPFIDDLNLKKSFQIEISKEMKPFLQWHRNQFQEKHTV